MVQNGYLIRPITRTIIEPTTSKRSKLPLINVSARMLSLFVELAGETLQLTKGCRVVLRTENGTLYIAKSDLVEGFHAGLAKYGSNYVASSSKMAEAIYDHFALEYATKHSFLLLKPIEKEGLKLFPLQLFK
ncbi:hypothetical protein GCM10027347_52730 [Larkinella harenae]